MCLPRCAVTCGQFSTTAQPAVAEGWTQLHRPSAGQQLNKARDTQAPMGIVPVVIDTEKVPVA